MRQTKRSLILAAGLLAALPLAGTARAAGDQPVATVNGKPITQKVYEMYLRQRQREAGKAGQQVNREQVINELVNRELLYQDALKNGIDKDPNVQFAIEQMKRNILIQGNVARLSREHPISDADVKKEYDNAVAAMNSNEYKARHILLKTEDEARAVIKELDKGAVFSDVAKAKSIGPSGKEGGDLGWFKPDQMVPEFAAAVKKLKKGEYTKQPVKTQFGWHVIKLEDTRKAVPPSYKDVSGQLKSMMRTQQLQEYVNKLRKQAKVDIKK